MWFHSFTPAKAHTFPVHAYYPCMHVFEHFRQLGLCSSCSLSGTPAIWIFFTDLLRLNSGVILRGPVLNAPSWAKGSLLETGLSGLLTTVNQNQIFLWLSCLLSLSKARVVAYSLLHLQGLPQGLAHHLGPPGNAELSPHYFTVNNQVVTVDREFGLKGTNLTLRVTWALI